MPQNHPMDEHARTYAAIVDRIADLDRQIADHAKQTEKLAVERAELDQKLGQSRDKIKSTIT